MKISLKATVAARIPARRARCLRKRGQPDVPAPSIGFAMKVNLRHLRMVLGVADTGSLTQAAALAHVSQPAVSSALNGVELAFGAALFARAPVGFAVTPAGAAAVFRLRRAFALLDPALAELAPRLIRTATEAQLTALIAVAECENFSAAARKLGLSQPSVHRAFRQIEREAARPLCERSAHGVVPSRGLRQLAMAARLAFAEIAQALCDVADLSGREMGRIVIGAMPLSRAVLLGPAIADFRAHWRHLPLRVIEGPYAELVLALRRGEADFLLGALRPETPDLQQMPLFDDALCIVARPDHRALQPSLSAAQMAQFPWVVPAEGTPARAHFAAMFAAHGLACPPALVETSSMDLMADLVGKSDHLGFVSRRQVARELALGLLKLAPFGPQNTLRPIGLTCRKNWHPTRAQTEMIAALQRACAALG